jgi:hypothetical protein
MRLDDGAANRQSHPHSVVFRRKESVEDLFRIIETCAAILDFDQKGFRVPPFQTNEEFPGTVLDQFHCLDPIDKQVEKQLLQLHAITRHWRQILSGLRLHGDALSRGLAFQQAEHLADNLIQIEIQIELSFLEGHLLEESADAPHYFSCLLTVANNPFRSFLCFSHTRRLGCEPAQAGLAVATTAASGWLVSCEMEAANSPTVAVCIDRDDRARLLRKASSIVFGSLISISKPY